MSSISSLDNTERQTLEDALDDEYKAHTTYDQDCRTPNRWPGKVPRFSSVHEACAAAVQGEIDNVALYDRVLKTTRRPDILSVYQALRSALDRHLPAFQHCAQRSPARRVMCSSRFIRKVTSSTAGP